MIPYGNQTPEQVYKKMVAGLKEIDKKAVGKTAGDGTIGSGENGYIARYKNKRVEVMADTQYEAQQMAAKHFRARKPYEVTVMLAELGGKQVTHRTHELFA